MWEEAADELDLRYDLSNTKIYLHGDGAPWTKEGLDYMPNCQVVLDRCHKDKAIKQT